MAEQDKQITGKQLLEAAKTMHREVVCENTTKMK